MEPALARMIPRGPRRLPFRIILLCAAIAGCAAEGPPPETSGPCPPGDCRIELEHVVRITDADEPGILPTSMVWIQETEAGTFVSASFDGTQIAEFGPDGRLTGVIGRAGQGPGEFLRLTTPIPGPGDTLFRPTGSVSLRSRTPMRRCAHLRELRGCGKMRMGLSGSSSMMRLPTGHPRPRRAPTRKNPSTCRSTTGFSTR